MSASRQVGKAALTLGALGIVLGDIGTSPLYAFRIAMDVVGGPDRAAVLGVLSLIVWAITFVVTVKYVAFILRTDNRGEGGALALAALLDLHRDSSTWLRGTLLMVAIAGAALMFGDAVITPAISVLSAMEGVSVISPGNGGLILPAAVALLAGIFLLQRMGAGRIGAAFGPVMLIWFILIALAGLVAIWSQPSVLGALSPVPALRLAVEQPLLAFVVMGAVFLAVTGGEALYVDLGQFGRPAITRAWLLIAMPALLLNYLGQGAVVLADPANVANPFYALFPPVLLLPVIGMATLAAIIASQAVITGTFGLTKQAVELNLLPPMSIRHTDDANERHVFVPAIGTLMALLSIAVAIAFGSSTNLSAAYGVAVAGTMATTTILYCAVRLSRPGRFRLLFLAALGPVLIIDLLFLSASLTKMVSGGYVPLAIALGVGLVSWSWQLGRRRMAELQEAQTMQVPRLLRRARGQNVSSSRTGVFLLRPGATALLTLAELSELAGVRFSRTIIVSVWIASVPRVPLAERLVVSRLDETTLRVDVRAGYLQRINLPSILGPCFDAEDINTEDVTYITGLERPKSPARITGLDDLLLRLFVFLSKLALRTSDRFRLPPTRTLEIGIPRQL